MTATLCENIDIDNDVDNDVDHNVDNDDDKDILIVDIDNDDEPP